MIKPKGAKTLSRAKKIRGIYQRGNIFWFARMQNGRRTQVSLRTSDYGEAVLNAESVTVPAGTFHNCLKSQETTPSETDLLEDKFYAPGVGNVLTVDATTGDRVELVRIRRGR